MDKNKMIPSKLYKYRPFSNQVLDQLVFDQLFFSDPRKFNDPLDTKPALSCDLQEEDLENILRRLVEQRSCDEMREATKKIKHIGSWTIKNEGDYSQKYAMRIIKEIRYNATNPDYENTENPNKFLLGREIEEELLGRYNKGIVCLAESPRCPLMWSHYGDQHKGLCIGYSIPEDAKSMPHKIDYDASDRFIKASDVEAMLNGDNDALQRVDQAVLLRKANSWKYEKEWRLMGSCGVQDSPLELEEVIFGMRCPSSVRYVVVKALANRCRPVKFFDMREEYGKFELINDEIDPDETTHCLPRRAREILEDFEIIDSND